MRLTITAALLGVAATAAAAGQLIGAPEDNPGGMLQKPILAPAGAEEQEQQQQQQQQQEEDEWEEDDVENVRANPLTRDFRRKVMHWLGTWHVPGLAVGVVDGEDIWTKGYGIATYPSTPVTPKTLFYGASTTKAFTAASLAIMISSGNYTVPALPGTTTPLDWTTPIAALIPADFVLLDDPWATAHITLEDALSHRTGLPRHDNANTHFLPSSSSSSSSSSSDQKRVATPRDVTRMLRYLPLNAAPRTKWQYCNQMFIVAAHVVQTLTGRWLGDVLREWLWAPLGMRATYFSLEDALAAPEHFAAGYSWVRERSAFERVPYMPTDEVSGAGAVVSCVDDYSRWIRMWLREEAPLPKAGHRAVKTPRMLIDPESVLANYGANATGTATKTETKPLPYDAPLAYALGWQVGSYRGHTFWTHSGGMHAYGAEVFFFPDLDFGVVTFANTALTSNMVGLFVVWQLVDDKLGVPVEERYDWEAKYRGFEDETDAAFANAINKTYPDRPSQPIPHALALQAYEGTYYHPAYLNFTLAIAAGDALVAHRSDATWPTVNHFEHVSGEYWMLFQRAFFGDRNGPLREYAPVQFRVGPDGKVEAMGITWLSMTAGAKDTVQGLAWFDKIE